EANYFKLPVIGSYSGGMAEAIINEKTGYLIKKNNLDDLVEKIIFLYENKEKRLEMGNFGHERVLHEFNYNKIINDFISLFKKILNQY
ncbi:MAG: glycosyltransferase, partial [Promethearchaeota archaeon]